MNPSTFEMEGNYECETPTDSCMAVAGLTYSGAGNIGEPINFCVADPEDEAAITAAIQAADDTVQTWSAPIVFNADVFNKYFGIEPQCTETDTTCIFDEVQQCV